MKILTGMPSPDSWGGPISSEPPFVAALRELGVDVTEEVYVYGDKDKPTRLFKRFSRVIRTTSHFAQLLQAQDFDLIHFNTAFDLKTILRDSYTLYRLNPKAKVFFKLHGSEAESFRVAPFWLRVFINYLAKRVDGFGVHTREEKENFLKLGFDERKFYFAKNAVTIQLNIPTDFSRTQKDSDQEFRLLFVSRFIAAKGLLETIRACAILRDRGLKFVLHCIGDGEILAQAKSEIARLTLQDVVIFTGYIPETQVSEYLLMDDILVFPTRHAEGFPNILFKAVAVGMPIVTTKIRAAADYLAESENCLFSTQDPQSIAEKISQLIDNKELRQKMSDKNLALGKTLLPKAIAREFIEIYQSILES